MRSADDAASIAVMAKLGMHFRGLETWHAQKVTTYEITAEEWHRARSALSGDSDACAQGVFRS